jgi:hypothetical protein
MARVFFVCGARQHVASFNIRRRGNNRARRGRPSFDAPHGRDSKGPTAVYSIGGCPFYSVERIEETG